MTNIHPALLTCDVPVFFATTEGQTRQIAEHLASKFRNLGFNSRAFDMADSDADWIDWPRIWGAVVGASVHGQRHQRAAHVFARTYAKQLNARPSAFFSVSMAAASRSATETDEAKRLAQAFTTSCGWRPSKVVCFAGALAYKRYGFLKRFIMKRIARARGLPTDTSRDHEFTDWRTVGEFAREIATLIRSAAQAGPPLAA